MEYYGRTNIIYRLSPTPFKKGGEGSVYNLLDNTQYVAKIYHSNVVTAELAAKIKYMTNNPPSQLILNQIAWPIDYLMDSSGMFVGFIMPKLKIDAELGELYIYPPQQIRLTNDQKLIVAINICKVIHEIHKAGYVFGDFNPCNIGVNLTSGHVAFLDTDSYHIFDTVTQKTYRCVVCLNGYVAPELIEKCKGTDYRHAPLPTFTEETDRFSLAIHIFRLLFNGFTPYNGIVETENASQASPGMGNQAIEKDRYCFKPGFKPLSVAVPPLNSFPQTIQDLFTRAFIVGRYHPALRPSAEEWDNALDSYRRSMVQCPKNPMHHYYKALPSCPYCEADTNYKTKLLGSMVSRSSSNHGPITVPHSNNQGSIQTAPRHKRAPATAPVQASTSAPHRSRGGFIRLSKRNLLILLLIFIVAAGVTIGLVAGLISRNRDMAVAKVVEDQMRTIRSPESLSLLEYADYYSKFGNKIDGIYDEYAKLTKSQKNKIDESVKRKFCGEDSYSTMKQYTEYKSSKIIDSYDAADVEIRKITALKDAELIYSLRKSVADTQFKNINTLYSSVRDEHKQYLADRASGEDVQNICTTYKTVETITKYDMDIDKYNDIAKYDSAKGEVIDLYNSLEGKTFLTTNEKLQDYVYNHDTVYLKLDNKYRFLQQVELEKKDIGFVSGYNVKARTGAKFTYAHFAEFEIPDSIKGVSIIEIADEAFKFAEGKDQVEKLIIPDTVLKIGSGAFFGFTNLNSITVPFLGMSMSETTTMPYNKVLGAIFGCATAQDATKTAFASSTDFTDTKTSTDPVAQKPFTVADLTWQYSCYNGDNKCLRSYFYYIPKSLINVTVTKQDKVPQAAFKNCANLKKIEFLHSLDPVGAGASFNGCSADLKITVNGVDKTAELTKQ